ncbi:hypothetical protein KP78_20850 [Jeotgalibacillus soli]|uniref:Uncharacterized protein n=1 Tax=Jeotgalibacillus soli TaxID=889306 RepID=A0A0C2VMR7_9BACL|nr:hypothetical protein KP78_20850 [Jeotgalibacillus soli]
MVHFAKYLTPSISKEEWFVTPLTEEGEVCAWLRQIVS